MRTSKGLILAVGCATTWIGAAHAQGRGGQDWTTAGGDAHRSSWIRNDAKISVDKIQKGGFGLAWKIKLNSEPTVASTLSSYIGYRGFRSFAFVGSASGELTAIDSDLGRVEWTKKAGAGAAARATAPCVGGMTANVARNTTAAFPGAAPAGRGGGGGRGGPAKSAVGLPGEGAVTIAAAANAANLAGPGGPGGRGARGARGATGATGPGRGPRLPEFLNALASDGTLHNMYVSNGEEPAEAISFVPANANARDLTTVDNVVYASTSGSCGGAPNGIWAADVQSKQTIHWTPPSGDIAGFAFGPDAVYAATTTGDLVALSPKKLEASSVYRAAGASFSGNPVVFEYKTKATIAAPTKDGKIHLVDAAGMTGSSYSAATSGSLGVWQDSSGAPWIVAPNKNSISAWKVEGDTPALAPGWASSDMQSPLAAIVVNGVVFALSNSPNATLHALDGATGKELWSSGKTMTASSHIGGISSGNTQIYVGTSDGTIYAFTFPIEH
jgi:hypothetical protein